MHAHNTDYGPNWLDEYADRLANNGQAMESVAFRQMAIAWHEDRHQLEDAQSSATALQHRITLAARAIAPPTAASASA